MQRFDDERVGSAQKGSAPSRPGAGPGTTLVFRRVGAIGKYIMRSPQWYV